MEKILEKIGQLGVVPVVAISRPEDASALGEALMKAGLACAEITFRTAAAEEVIKQLSMAFPEMLVGAGTVLTVGQAESAVRAGARFIVSPGFDAKIVDWCRERDMLVTPGVATPTEINMALDKGLHVLKFFPAEALGGVKTLKAIAAPYKGVKFIPTGGVEAENLKDYLSLPAVHACGGSWMVKASLIDSGKFDEITSLAREALQIVQQVRGGDA
jgi:2-dehydro-3-deoxyphosphogluconate aldolase/(4S)-4-hydroxy-2-oxoglutarate aldolase